MKRKGRMGKSFNFTTHIDLCDLEIHVEITDYHPHRPPPHASHPDAPGYDDCGDNEEYSFTVYLIADHEHHIPLPDYLYKDVMEMIEEQITEEAGL